MSALILNTETTGMVEPRPVEIAWVRLSDPVSLAVTETFLDRYDPRKPIELGAMATHHIMDADVAGLAPYTEFRLPDDVAYLIGHNVDYDWAAIGSPPVKRICTLALCRMFWPHADSHGLGAMLYLLMPDYARDAALKSHQADQDVQHCRAILKAILHELGPTVDSWDALWEASEVARVPSLMPFGKHRGVPIADVPADYKRWLLGQPDVDPYLRKALA